AIAGVASEPDDDTIKLLDLLGHSLPASSTRRGRATDAVTACILCFLPVSPSPRTGGDEATYWPGYGLSL
ncbi:MAG: hypothetical protein ACLQFR_17810, partial [Streptosporangiaceae bacterium]